MRLTLFVAALLVAPACTTPRVLPFDAGSDMGATPPDAEPPDEGLDEGLDEGPPDEGPPDLFVCTANHGGCTRGAVPDPCCAPYACGSTSLGDRCGLHEINAPCTVGTDCVDELDCDQHDGTGAFHCCRWFNDPMGRNSCTDAYDCCGGHPCTGGHCS